MSEVKSLFKHSINYLFAHVANKALAFISIPVYTYLLTVEEYGIFNVFISTIGIVSILFTLNTEIAISRYYYDANDQYDFKEFVGTSVILSSICFILTSTFFIIYSKYFSSVFNFEKLLTLLMIPVSLYTIINSIFQQIYNPLKESKKIAVISSIQTYSAFILSTIFILTLDNKKYYGQVWGTLLAMFILGGYLIKQIKPYIKFNIKKEHIKYILNYSIPYIPYSLSSLIVSQFGKIFIGQSEGYQSAGLYSFSSNIAALMIVIISVFHSAWNPYYFTYMNKKEYQNINRDYDIIWRITLIFGVLLALFGNELGYILGKKEYHSDLYLIPILIIGYLFYQWSYVYLRNTGYSRKTIWNAIIVISSGIINIVLSTILICYLKELGIALAFSLSYLFMLVIAWMINRFFLKVYTPKCSTFIRPLIIVLPILLSPFIINIICNNIYYSISIKLIESLLIIYIITKPYKKNLLLFFQSRKK